MLETSSMPLTFNGISKLSASVKRKWMTTKVRLTTQLGSRWNARTGSFLLFSFNVIFSLFFSGCLFQVSTKPSSKTGCHWQVTDAFVPGSNGQGSH